MKYTWLLTVLLLAGCRKSNYNPPAAAPGCITRLIPRVTDVLVSPSAEDSALAALAAAHVPTDGLQIAYTNLEAGVPPNGDTIYYVSCYLFLNGLPVEVGGAGFSFVHGQLTSGLPSYRFLLNTNDTAGHQDLQYLRRVFLNRIQLVPEPVIVNTDYADSCLTATLCYAPDYLFRRVDGVDNVQIKAWMVSCHGNSVFVRDDNGQPQLAPDPRIVID